jgi:hypothetical protein
MGLFLRKAPRLLHDHDYPPGSSDYIIRAAQNGYIKIVCNPIKILYSQCLEASSN